MSGLISSLFVIGVSGRKHFEILAFMALLLSGAFARLSAAPPNWTVNPADFQFSMSLVVRVSSDGVLSNDPGNIVGVFVGTELRGVAAASDVDGQVYYFVTVFSNQYNGEILRFSVYHALNDDIYPAPDSVNFLHNGIVGSLLSPFVVHIDLIDAPPVIHCPAAVTVFCTAKIPAPDTAAVSAADDRDIPLKTFLFDSAPYDSLCVNRFRIDRYYRATDAAGNSASCLQRITVHDDLPPNLLFMPLNVTVACNAIPPAGSPAGLDNCVGDVSVVYGGQTQSPGDCNSGYTITRTWMASDACGNTTARTQRITVLSRVRSVFRDRAGVTDEIPNGTPEGFRITPNPTDGEVRFELPAFAGVAVRLAVFNSLGVLVWEQRLPAAPEMPLWVNLREKRDLPAGVYYVLAESGGRRYVKTMMLMRH